MDKLQTLLRSISEIVKQDAQHREEQRLRGELFNVFKILKLDTSETRTHSAFIAELLNPKGDHGVGDKFLRSFVNTIDCLKTLDFNTKDARVDVEFCIEGGRIDIRITSHNKAIVIENKIYADDQPCQLVRYRKYAKKDTNDYRLLYLTLYGEEASEKSTQNKLKDQEDYYAISYDNEIIKWLAACLLDSIHHPIVRETIIQYQSLLRNLTNQNMDTKYRDKILDIMVEQENVETFATIASLLDEWQDRIVKNYLINPLEEFAKKHKLGFEDCIFNEDGSSNRGRRVGLYFYRKNWQNASIWILSNTSNWRDFYIGISNRGDDFLKVTPKNVFGRKPDDEFPYGWEYLDQYSDWTDDVMVDMVNGKVAEYIEEKVLSVLDKIRKQRLPMP